jgi:hypothetical protein
MQLNPSIDYKKIEAEINAENKNNLSMVASGNWFKKKGYIKGYRNIKPNPFLVRRQPVVLSTKQGDWKTAGMPPYIVKFTREVVM